LADFKSASEAGADKREAMELCVEKADQPSLAYQLAGSDSSALTYLINLLANRPEDRQLVEKCRADLFSLLQLQADDPNASADTIAALAQEYAARGNRPKAISYYRKALAQDYSRVEWHYQLANLLAASGDLTGGMGEARICLRIHPQMKEAETLLGTLSVQSTAPPG
jgi:tetratricopeptide (TPR) repeat protein